MGQHILPGNPPVEINLKRSGRARRMSLRVSSLDGRVTLTLPRGVSERDGLAFASEKADWLRRQLAGQGAPVAVGIGAEVPLGGRLLPVLGAETGRAPRVEADAIRVPGNPETAPRRVQALLRQIAGQQLAEASDLYAGRLGRRYEAITLRDTRSRWGSCTSTGGLMYSWRLVMAPKAVLDYVAAHEVAHLAEMNHSAAFWLLVEQIHGDYAAPRDWLRRHGAGLHRYRFE
ncbi:M48 family metallopeptidase [Pseudooceanicola sp. 502str34]